MKTIDNYIKDKLVNTNIQDKLVNANIQERLVINSKLKIDNQIDDIDTIDKLLKYINAKDVYHHKVYPSSKLDIYDIECDGFYSLEDKPNFKKRTYLNMTMNNLSDNDIYITDKYDKDRGEYNIDIDIPGGQTLILTLLVRFKSKDTRIYAVPSATNNDIFIKALQAMAKIYDFIQDN